MEAFALLRPHRNRAFFFGTREKLYEKPIGVADREMVEKADVFLEEARSSDVALLIVGDPFGVRKVYEPPRFMTINMAIEQLLEVDRMRGEDAYDEGIACVVLARLGTEDQRIIAGSMSQLLEVDFGPPLHCLVIVGQTHPMGEEMPDHYRLVGSSNHDTNQSA